MHHSHEAFYPFRVIMLPLFSSMPLFFVSRRWLYTGISSTPIYFVCRDIMYTTVQSTSSVWHKNLSVRWYWSIDFWILSWQDRALEQIHSILLGRVVSSRFTQQTSRKINEDQETSRKINKDQETSRNIKKHQETSIKIKKHQETSRNQRKNHDDWPFCAAERRPGRIAAEFGSKESQREHCAWSRRRDFWHTVSTVLI